VSGEPAPVGGGGDEGERHPPLPLILGPTGVGKTEVALALACRLKAEMGVEVELISADSRSFYRGLDIGTAKPTPEQRLLVPHHLIDIREPHERYDVMQFRRDVARLIGEIRARSRLPLVVGGSTLYVQALTGRFFQGPSADLELRRRLARLPLEELYKKLEEVDPEAARRIDPHDRQRLVRALEVYELTGRPISELQRDSEPFPYRFFKLGLVMDRAALYRRIEERVDRMVEQGLIEEARRLFEEGRIPEEAPAYRTIGYEELFAHFAGRISLERAIALIKRNSRRLAKRQLTFFRRDPEIRWLDVTGKSADEVAGEVLALLEGAGLLNGVISGRKR